MFARADFRHRRFIRFRKTTAKKVVHRTDAQLLLSGPGRGLNPIRQALHRDLKEARDVRIIVAYFLPAWRLRRDLARVVRRGGRVQLLLAGRSDVTVSQLAVLINRAFRDQLPASLRLVGEISQFRERTHWYFDIKDAGAVISCVMWQSAARKAGFTPAAGQQAISSAVKPAPEAYIAK